MDEMAVLRNKCPFLFQPVPHFTFTFKIPLFYKCFKIRTEKFLIFNFHCKMIYDKKMAQFYK